MIWKVSTRKTYSCYLSHEEMRGRNNEDILDIDLCSVNRSSHYNSAVE